LAEVIVALDVSSRGQAMQLVDALGDSGTFYKVGLELFTREGPDVVAELRDRGKKVFLDLKLHDIPNTVAETVRAASALDVDLLTVHAMGGKSMMEVAVQAAADAAESAGMRRPVALLGVTVLTSVTASEAEVTWGRESLSLRDEVVRLGTLAADSGLKGVVASVLEVRALKRELGPDFLVVTPGIRLAGGESHDQARVATPSAAARAGADFLVVGRAVTAAPDPRVAMDRVLDELDEPPLQKVGEGGAR
jgi:orotidine-5'-phosphate decarboxylase